jgi:hypothetical protein
VKRREKPSLDGVRDKLRRAKAHQDNLHKMIDPISELDPHPFKGEVRGDGREHLYRWHNPPILDRDAELVLGDCVHNLRSALDHLAYQLVVLNGKPTSGRPAFPIFDHPPRERRKCRWRDVPFSVPGISDKANKIIEAVQPYKGGNIGRWLTVLRDLDNIDKHRHLLDTIPAVDFASTASFGDLPFGAPRCVFLPTAPVHGQVVVRVRWSMPRHELDPQLHFRVGMRFDKRVGKRLARRSVKGVLAHLVWTVEDEIVNTLFAPLFPSPGTS